MQRIGREGILVAGGGRALLLQIAHPGVSRGVAAHSDFVNRPLDRLRATLTYVYAISFGTPQEVAFVTEQVSAVHRSVVGPGYDANDPDLQCWVAATLYDTAIEVFEDIFGRLDPVTADAVYQQYAVLGTALQVPMSLWPADRAGFRAYWDHMVATTEVTAEARLIARDILFPRAGPRIVRVTAPLNRLLTTALLPTRIRAEFGLVWDAKHQRRYNALMALTRATYPRLPIAVREAPMQRCLRDLRRRMSTPCCPSR